MQTYIKENVQQWTNVGEHVSIVDSTNDEIQRRIRKATQNGDATVEGLSIRCDFQSAGKGRLARSWEADPCQNLLVSYALDASSLPTERLFAISQNVALVVARLVESYLPNTSVKIKWPNDVFVGDRKIAGILIETILSQGRIGACIVGIGLNIGQIEFPVGSRGTSLNLEGVTNISPKAVWARLTQELQIAHQMLKKGSDVFFDIDLLNDYESILYGVNAFARYKDLSSNTSFVGRLLGVTSSGYARIISDGEVRTFGMNDIKFVKILNV